MVRKPFGRGGSRWRAARRRSARRAAAGVLGSLLLAACGERSRLVFETPGGGGDGEGPVTTIESPVQDTTRVPPGPGVFVTGRAVDADGVDSVYFEITGGVTQFSPLDSDADTVRFALPITTQGQGGRTIDISIFGVDRDGNRGEPARRRLVVE